MKRRDSFNDMIADCNDGRIDMILTKSIRRFARNDEDDNKPIGIILCTDKDALTVEYALYGLSNNLFASKYTYYIPDKEELIAEVKKIVRKWNDWGTGTK